MNEINKFKVHWEKLKRIHQLSENTINKLKSSGGSFSDAEIITLLHSSMPESYDAVMRAIDIIVSKHPEDVDLNYVKSYLLQEELQRSDKTINKVEIKPQLICHLDLTVTIVDAKVIRNVNVNFLRENNFSSTSVHQRCESDSGTNFVAANRDQNVNKQYLVSNSSTISFVVDSDATNHMINKKYEEHLVNTMDVNLSIAVAKSGFHLQAHKSGNLKLTSQEGKSTTIKDVLSYDNLEFNLLSVKKIESHSFKKIFNKNSEVLVTENVIGNLYMIKFQIDTSTALLTSNEDLMHRIILSLEKKPTRILEVVSSDVIGHITPTTYDSTRYSVPEKLEEYEALVTAKFETRISRIHHDIGGEYNSRQFIEFFKSKCSHIDYTTPRNPEINGLSEHFNNRTLLDSVRCMLLLKKKKNFLGFPEEENLVQRPYKSAGLLPSELLDTFEKALESGWKTAIDEELQTLEKNNVWKLVSKPRGENIIDSKWVFTEKEILGQKMKKAKLVARGCFQDSTTVEE
ncbi:hypothetical protein PR048_024720, partial [Dryococelus australis]